MRFNSENQAWLDQLKVGDQVAIYHSRGFEPHYTLHAVQKITPTRRFTLSGLVNRTYDRQGDERGAEMYWRTHMEPVTDEVRESILRKTCLSKIQNARFPKLATDTLVKLAEAIDADPASVQA